MARTTRQRRQRRQRRQHQFHLRKALAHAHSRRHRRINTLINGYRGVRRARRHQIGIFAEWVREVDVRLEHEEGAWGRDRGKCVRVAPASTNSACCYLLAKMKSRKSILKSENATKINTRARPSSVDVFSVVSVHTQSQRNEWSSRGSMEMACRTCVIKRNIKCIQDVNDDMRRHSPNHTNAKSTSKTENRESLSRPK